MADANIRAVITAKDDASKVLDNFGNSVEKNSKRSAEAILGLGAVVVGFGALSVKAFSESEDLIAQTNAVLKSTGGIAGVTADQVTKLSKSLQAQTKFSDEDVRSVENLLLTFTSISKDIFPEATRVVLDMATALGEDTKSASIQLGKALQDPILGITALRRVGVNFNDSQKAVIQNLVETGHKAEAQKAILKELETEFGGSAVAAGNTFSGALAKLRNSFNDVEESIGKVIVNVADRFLQAVLNWYNGIGGVDAVMKLLHQTLKDIEPFIPAIAGTIGGLLAPALAIAAADAVVFVASIAPFATLGAIIAIKAHDAGIGMDDFKNALKRAKDIGKEAYEALRLVKETLFDNGPILQMNEGRFQGFANVLMEVRRSIDFVIEKTKEMYKWFTNLTPVIILGQFFQQVFWPILKDIAKVIWTDLAPALEHLGDSVERLWKALNPALTDALKIVGGILLGLYLAAVFTVIGAIDLFNRGLSFVITVISDVIGWISNLIGWFGNLAGTVWNTIKTVGDIFANLIPAVKDVIGIVVSIFAGLGSLILNAIGDAGKMLYNVGKDIIKGLVRGIGDAIGGVGSAIGKVADDVGGAVKGALHSIHVPGFASGVQNFSGGLAIVGERGPELVNLPAGSSVIPNHQLGAGSSINITINAGYFNGSDVEARKYAQQIAGHLKSIANSKNISVAQMLGT